jgi:hypothetical protein
LTDGSIQVNNGGSVSSVVFGNFTNTNGAITIAAGGSMTTGGNYTQSGAAPSLKVDGGLAASLASVQSGTVQGTGTIGGGVDVSGGTIKPGDSPGILTIDGTYTQSGPSVFESELGGTVAGSGYGQLRVTESATLTGGTLDVDEINGFTAVAGNDFFVLVAGALTGTFSTVDLADAPLPTGDRWNVVYNANGVELEVTRTRTPEPSTWLLLGTALAFIAGYGIGRRVVVSKAPR